MNYLEKGIKAHQANNLILAKTCYLNHLNDNQKDPNANQLLGLIYYNEGHFLRAKHYMLISLKYNHNQPHVLVNLSAVYSKIKLIEEAISCLLSAIKLDKNCIDAYLNLVRIYRENNRLVDAEHLIESSLLTFPNNIKLIKELGNIYKLTNRVNELISTYSQYEQLHKNDMKLKFDLALALRQVGKSNDALSYYKILIKSGMKNYQLYHNTANAYSDIGDLDNAIIHYSNAIQENPLYIDSHINLNEILWEKNKLELFLSSYVNVLKIYPDDLALNFNYISTLIRTSNFKYAETVIQKLPHSVSNTNEIYLLSAKCLYHRNKKNEAILLLESNMNFDDIETDIDYTLEYTKYLIENEQPFKATKFLINLLSREPECQMAIAYLGTCYRLTNNSDEASINNYSSMVKEYKINTPSDYVSISAFCCEINKYLNELHTSDIQPLEQSLSNGTQTRGNLFDNPPQILKILMNEIETCLTHYNKEISKLNGNFGIKPAIEYSYAGSWSARLKEQGFHSMHVHPMGWLSAVFYVDIPSEISTTDKNNGWLKFGSPNLKLNTPLLSSYFTQPEIGKLVIFPSYMWHGTIPFDSNEYRTTIAFDVKKLK